jgi:predicted anti-sigma-YlaC factor YlaD
MFSYHAKKDLSAYVNGELSPGESSRVAEHLLGCPACRNEFDLIKLGVKMAEQLPQFTAPDELWTELEASRSLLPERARVGHARSNIWRPQFAAAACLILFMAVVATWFYTRATRPFWEVARIDGAPRIGSEAFSGKGRLAVGDWLETDNGSRAKIDVGTIGQVEIDTNTRVRLVEAKATEHRLELARGRLSARIWAPPRLFFVDTPSAVAADLGCAYTLEVDEDGGSILRVTSGWVALQLEERESMVPAGAACATRVGRGPGTPYFEDSSASFRQALAKLDFEPADTEWSKIPALDLVLAEARPRDTLTLWHLLSRVNESDRIRVFDRMATLSPPPPGVSREGILQLNEPMLQLWKESLVDLWTNESRLRRTWVNIWTKAIGNVKAREGKAP